MVSDNIGDGDTVKKFESEFSGLFGLRSNHAVTVSSGTDALQLGLLAMGIGQGDEVIIPSYLCTSPYHAIKNAGAVPVLCDIGHDYNISFESAKQKITDKTKAIIVAHLFGLPADIDPFMGLGVPIIEDCAQAISAKYNGEPVGSFGKFSFFSFYATKMITTGYGGMLLTKDTKFAASVRSMRHYDKKEDLSTSFNCGMSDIQAAIGINQLKRLDHFVNLRGHIAEMYNRKFLQTHHEIPQKYDGRDNVYFRYPIRLQRSLKDALKFLYKNNIEAAMPVFKPLHRYLDLPASDFPGTEEAYLKTMSIPIYPALLNKEVEYIIKVVSRII